MQRPRPDLSVVVPSVNGWEDLSGTLAALEAQQDVVLEVLVPDRCGRDLRHRVEAEHPDARVIPAQPGTTIPDLRALAFAAATADAVAVIEDHVLVPPGWARALLDAHGDGTPVVAGSVRNVATERWVDEAAFLCEYHHLLPPLPEGSVRSITGNNTVYARALLERYRRVTEAGVWENHLHDAMLEDGVPLTCRPDIVVGHKMHYTVGQYLHQRYLYARSYAGARMRGAPSWKRLFYGAASCALPPVLLARIVRSALSKQVSRWVLVRSLPLLGLFVGAWAWGEVVGSLVGPGDALSHVR